MLCWSYPRFVSSHLVMSSFASCVSHLCYYCSLCFQLTLPLHYVYCTVRDVRILRHQSGLSVLPVAFERFAVCKHVGCFEDVLQLWPLFFVVDCRLPSDGSH